MAHIDAVRDDLMAAGVRYVFGWYTDIHGVPKSKCVPVESLPSMAAGSSSTPWERWRGWVISGHMRTSAPAIPTSTVS